MSDQQDTSLAEAISLLQSGDWGAAHRIVQGRNDPLACRIHGLLHRMEGDWGNAEWWYRQAGVPYPDVSNEEELQQITGSLE